MSVENKFFDEQAETALIGKTEVVTRLRNLVELETELHLTNLKNRVGGACRALWVNVHEEDGYHWVGLEIVEPEGDLWEMEFPPGPTEETASQRQIWLECRRCHRKLEAPVPEAANEFVVEGFQVARHCTECKATTPWVPAAEPVPQSGTAVEVATVASPPPETETLNDKKRQEELRQKGRAPIKLLIKVIRQKYGTTLEDICETENVSRTGALFLTSQNYDIGESVRVIVPYKEGDMSIPVPARVVRQGEVKGSFYKGVAVHMEGGKK